jgi:hypothetical protein
MRPVFINDTQVSSNSYQFFQNVEELKLIFFWEPLYVVEFKRLSSLVISLHHNMEPVTKEFPSLRKLSIYLYGGADRVPIIYGAQRLKLFFLSSIETSAAALFIGQYGVSEFELFQVSSTEQF